jgi:ribulose-5-phosphate 4-epimerase/fuculose-1-phosphate aldolase
MTTTNTDTERRTRKRELALAYRLFAVFRWGDLGDGHITARDPDRTDCFWVLRSGLSFHKATVDDLVLVGSTGAVVESSEPDVGNVGFNETAYNIHWPIHEARPDIVAAAHTHTQWGTPFSAERRLLPPITQEACMVYDDHSVFDDEEVQVQSIDGGKRIAAALGSNRAVILANHGLLTTGPGVAEATATFVTMERVCEAVLKAPGAHPISDRSAAVAKEGLRVPASFRRAFEDLVDRHIANPDAVG